MRVLVVGAGGREHALTWALARSPRVTHVLCAPGNAGIAAVAECVAVAVDDLDGLVRLAQEQEVDLTIVGPELPLTLGIVDRFAAEGLRVFGPTQGAARLEGSKTFSKDFMQRHGIPTAAFASFDDPARALAYVRDVGGPLVVKADGLAAGKGVFVCERTADAEEAVRRVMEAREFGTAGARVVVEEFLDGEELSFMAISDGRTVRPLMPSQDHKRALDGDRGPNTGGMGAYSPPALMTPALHEHVMRDVVEPVVRGMAADGTPYSGVLYAGLMVRDGRAKVLEFNVRFGDPEAQAVLIRLRSDLAALAEHAVEGTLAEADIEWDPRPAVCVVLAAEGYPGPVDKGRPISGLGGLASWRDGVVFHAATARAGDDYITSGGRVLGVTALGPTIAAAIAEAYRAVGWISWPGMHYRHDIGHRAIGRVADA